MEISFDEETEETERERRRRIKKRREKEKKRREESSEELTVPPELTKLSVIFKQMIDNEIRRIIIEEEIEYEYEQDIKIDLEELLESGARANDARVTARDVALGFMQTLILKTSDIIQVKQEKYFDPIYISKGNDFDKPIKQ